MGTDQEIDRGYTFDLAVQEVIHHTPIGVVQSARCQEGLNHSDAVLTVELQLKVAGFPILKLQQWFDMRRQVVLHAHAQAEAMHRAQLKRESGEALTPIDLCLAAPSREAALVALDWVEAGYGSADRVVLSMLKLWTEGDPYPGLETSDCVEPSL